MINRLHVLGRRLWFWAIAVLSWLGLEGLAWAQAGGVGVPAPPQQGEGEAPPYVLPYALVILCLGLGLTVVLNSSKRRERAKPEVFGEPK
jgi:hypothetical protein